MLSPRSEREHRGGHAPAGASRSEGLRDGATETSAPSRAEDDPIAGINAGHVVFRVRGNMGVRLGRMVTIPLLLAGGLAAGPFQLGVTPLDVVPPVVVLGLVAVLVGRRFPDIRCSEPKCGTRLRDGDDTCPRCGGRVAGEIGHVQERLEAEERVEAESRRGAASGARPPERTVTGR